MKKAGRQERREGALSRLEAQLKSGKKPEKIKGNSTGKMVELGENDVKRIKKEMGILKESLKGETV